MTSGGISRRSLLGAAPLLLNACGTRESEYFGETRPPRNQHLVYIIGAEPETLDPGKATGGYEDFIIPALFEGLTNHHPVTAQPVAGLATHYEVDAERASFTFYLRGHPQPRGIALEHAGPGKYARPTPAYWSDGTIITAHDFVYSWRRVVDPETATPQYAYLMYYIQNAEAINAGRSESRQLGVRALDPFTFQVDLRSPTYFFLHLTSHRTFVAVPRHVLQATRRRNAEEGWTEPACMVTSGAFMLQQRRPYDRIVVKKNPRYYDAGVVALERLTYLPVSEGTTSVNLYKAGETHSMAGDRLPPLFWTAVRRKKDAYAVPAYFHILPGFNVHRRPFDNVLLRYALNMATDKRQIAAFFGAGRTAARAFVPPLPEYRSPERIVVQIEGQAVDVLEYSAAAARNVLAIAGYTNGIGRDGKRLALRYLLPDLPHSLPIAEILQQQWRTNLNIELTLEKQEVSVFLQSLISGDYSGLSETGGGGEYFDPSAFLDLFVTGGALSSSWSDAAYDAKLARANSTADPELRMLRLAECEECLLRAMPVLPLLFYSFAYLQKPFVRGIGENALGFPAFKYAWIDTQWRPA